MKLHEIAMKDDDMPFEIEMALIQFNKGESLFILDNWISDEPRKVVKVTTKQNGDVEVEVIDPTYQQAATRKLVYGQDTLKNFILNKTQSGFVLVYDDN